MLQFKKICTWVLAGALVFSVAGCQPQTQPQAQNEEPTAEQERFDAFIEKEFVDTMESDYTTAHVYLQDPESFGVDPDKISVSLGTRMDEESQQASLDAFEATCEEFRTFDRDELSAEQQDIYDIVDYQVSLSESLSAERFDYYAPMFESISGLHYQLPTLFADWQLRNEEDVQDLITLMSDVRPYVDSALEYTRTQEEKGLLMLDLDSVISYCEGIVESGEDSAVLQAMNDSIAALELGEEKTAQYQEQLRTAFSDSFLSAYQDILDTMRELQSSGENNEQGLAQFEYGKEYYALLLQQSIGSNKTPEEVKAMMEEAFNEHLQQLQMYAMAYPEETEQVLSQDLPKTGYTSYDEILQDLQGKIFDSFPQVEDLSYQIEDVNEEIASDSGVAAYFNIPSLDGDTVKQLRVNPNNAGVDSIDTFSTVAHEGFPGHMYQYAYMYENIDSNFIKALANVGAYTEGFAVYAQYESLQYLEGISQELLDVYREYELLTYCLVIAADIGIHYEGWSLQEFEDYFTEMGLSIGSGDALYQQLQANPAVFETYYVGYHEIMDLREKAEDALGNAFDEKAFNEALLESGTAPFSVVERHIDAYIESAS